MMQFHEQALKHLEARVKDTSAFEKKHGRQAASMVVHLPALLRLFHRIAFDLSLPLAARHIAGLVVMYLGEPDDFIGENRRSDVESLIDDVWLAFRALRKLSEHLDDAKLAQHWRSDTPFPDVAAYAHNVGSIDSQVPPRILALLQKFLGV